MDTSRRDLGLSLLAASVAAVGLALVVARYTRFEFVELFVVASGLAGLTGVVLQVVREPAGSQNLGDLLEEVRDDEDPRVDRETLDVIEIVTRQPGRTTFGVLMADRRRWTVARLVEAVRTELDGDEPEHVQLHERLFGEVLPEMDAQGIVEFDRTGGVVALTDDGVEYGRVVGLADGTSPATGSSERTEQGEASEYRPPSGASDAPSSDVPTPEGSIGVEKFFHLFKNRSRIAALAAFDAADGELTVRNLAEHVVREVERYDGRETEPDDLAAEERDGRRDRGAQRGREDGSKSAADRTGAVKRAYASLSQTHLDSLTDAGLLRQVDRDTYARTDLGRAVRRILAERGSLGFAGEEWFVACELLKNARRRRTLRLVADDGPVDLGDLAEQIAARENDVPVSELSSSERKRVYVGLYQCHLPKLDDEGVVAFDPESGRVAATAETDRFLALLAGVERRLRAVGALSDE